MRLLNFVTVCFLLLSVCAVNADEFDTRHVGRYAMVTPSMTAAQADLLSVVIDVHFGAGVVTVGDALKQLLVRSGYSLADLDSADPFLPVLLSRPLPQVHRHLGPIHLKDALIALAGPAWSLAVDPVNRLISYELLSQYRPATDVNASDDSSATQ